MARVVAVYALAMVYIASVLIYIASAWGFAHEGDSFMFQSLATYNGHNIFEIHLIDTGTKLTFKPHGWDNVSDYVWSPNGEFIARVISPSGEPSFIEVLDSHWRLITHFERGVFNPNWMPDSQSLVFTTWEREQLQVYSANIYDSQNWQWLMTAEEYWRDLTLSPDGQSWIFTVYTPRSYGALFLMSIDGGDSHEIALFMDESTWSPDSQFVTYQSIDLRGNSEINIVNLSTGRSEVLVRDLRYPSEPAWSPDGSRIAFVAYDGNDTEIYIVNVDGTNVRQITFNNVNDSNPAWMP